jgi:hypothetical protein
MTSLFSMSHPLVRTPIAGYRTHPNLVLPYLNWTNYIWRTPISKHSEVPFCVSLTDYLKLDNI